MVTISARSRSGLEELTFQVATGSAAFAGSRHRTVAEEITVPLVRELHARGFSLVTGCACQSHPWLFGRRRGAGTRMCPLERGWGIRSGRRCPEGHPLPTERLVPAR